MALSGTRGGHPLPEEAPTGRIPADREVPARAIPGPRAARRLALALALLLTCTDPAAACTPLVSVGFGGLMLGWLVWLLMTPFAGKLSTSRLFWLWAPVGFVGFAVPSVGLVVIVPVLLLIAFPMHLAVEFLDALFHRDLDFRPFRLFYYGLPLAVTLVAGLGAKAALYGENGGLRAFAWNYLHESEAFFFAVWLVVGAAVLLQHRAANRSAWPF